MKVFDWSGSKEEPREDELFRSFRRFLFE